MAEGLAQNSWDESGAVGMSTGASPLTPVEDVAITVMTSIIRLVRWTPLYVGESLSAFTGHMSQGCTAPAVCKNFTEA